MIILVGLRVLLFDIKLFHACTVLSSKCFLQALLLHYLPLIYSIYVFDIVFTSYKLCYYNIKLSIIFV